MINYIVSYLITNWPSLVRYIGMIVAAILTEKGFNTEDAAAFGTALTGLLLAGAVLYKSNDKNTKAKEQVEELKQRIKKLENEPITRNTERKYND